MCFVGAERTRERKTIDVSPKPGLKTMLSSCVSDVLAAFLGAFGNKAIRENG